MEVWRLKVWRLKVWTEMVRIGVWMWNRHREVTQRGCRRVSWVRAGAGWRQRRMAWPPPGALQIFRFLQPAPLGTRNQRAIGIGCG